jgi:hypothetical protein
MSDPVEIVEEYLRLHMIPDPDSARHYCAPDIEIRFDSAEWVMVRAGLAKP